MRIDKRHPSEPKWVSTPEDWSAFNKTVSQMQAEREAEARREKTWCFILPFPHGDGRGSRTTFFNAHLMGSLYIYI